MFHGLRKVDFMEWSPSKGSHDMMTKSVNEKGRFSLKLETSLTKVMCTYTHIIILNYFKETRCLLLMIICCCGLFYLYYEITFYLPRLSNIKFQEKYQISFVYYWKKIVPCKSTIKELSFK